MEVGTIEDLEDPTDENHKKASGTRPRSSGSGGKNGGDDGNSGGGSAGGGGGGNDLSRNKSFEEFSSKPEKSRILMWFLLLVVVMTFGGLIGAYVVISTNDSLEWKPFSLPYQVWVSTVIILLSSFTYTVAQKSVALRKTDRSRKWFIATAVFGGMFVASQIMAWLELVSRGLYVAGNPYVGFFYILTAVHAVHVIGGICALGYILLRTWESTESAAEQTTRVVESTVIGWYWHTMDALWLVLLFLLGFWK